MTERWLAGRRVVVTAGGTREPVDPVRYLGNRSSGRMGNALALAARELGAQVTLVTTAPAPPDRQRIDVVRVETAQEMHDAVLAALPGSSLLVMAAAVADWRPAVVAPRKLRKSEMVPRIDLVPTVDILAALRGHPARAGVVVVGFAAETHDMLTSARAKLTAKGLDMIVANDVSQPGIGMGAEDNAVSIVAADGSVVEVARASKDDVARAVLEQVRPLLDRQR